MNTTNAFLGSLFSTCSASEETADEDTLHFPEIVLVAEQEYNKFGENGPAKYHEIKRQGIKLPSDVCSVSQNAAEHEKFQSKSKRKSSPNRLTFSVN